MTDDEKRLAEIRKSLLSHPTGCHLTCCARCWLLAKLDESERARTANAQQYGRDVASLSSERRRAEDALAEERAKRGAAEETVCVAHAEVTAMWKARVETEQARAEAAEARVRELETRVIELENALDR